MSHEVRWTRNLSPAVAGDVVLALGILVAAFAAISSGEDTWVGYYAIATLGILPLAVRRFFPVPVLAAAVAGTAYAAADGSWWPFAALVAFYSVGAHAHRRAAVIAGSAGLLVLAIPVVSAIDWSPLGWNDVALFVGRLAPLAAAWLLGENLRTRRAYLHGLEERAAQLEREQAANARRAAAEEQARIAREVHDVVAHNLSVIIVQATAADAVFASDPAEARRAVRTIGASARRALGELRHVLGRGDGQSPAAFAPQPDLSRLGGLLDQVRLAGLDVALEIEGTCRELDPALELSAYRIVQEALTNTLRHAGASRARVTLRYEPDALDVEVVDDGAAPPGVNGAAGQGLIGMRERAATFGGHVEAGSEAAGGFRVAARLPLPAVGR
jgi:signal transduction histidine kinase